MKCVKQFVLFALLIFMLFLLSSCQLADILFPESAPVIHWAVSLGGSSVDTLESVIETTDHNYVVAGYSHSADGDLYKNNGGDDFWIGKFSSTGVFLWSRIYGGSDYDQAFCIKQTIDGGFIVAGHTNSSDFDVTSNHGGYDIWVIKLNALGNKVWEKTYGGSDDETARDIIQTPDGGYVIAGQTGSNNGDVTGFHGDYDCWIIRISSTGVLQWQKALGGTSYDNASSIQQTADGGFIVAGSSYSNNGNVSSNKGSSDVWLVKLFNNGNIQWERNLGGTAADMAYSVKQTNDNGYILVGETFSDNLDVTSNHGSADMWVVKTNSIGIIQWQKTLGGTDYDNGKSVVTTTDGGYAILGYSRSQNGDISNFYGNYDFILIKLSESANLKWSKNYGGSAFDMGTCVILTHSGDYLMVGTSESDDDDVNKNEGGRDFWIVKIGS